MCLRVWGLALYVQKQTLNICNIAIYQNPISIKFAEFQSEDACIYAVSENAIYFDAAAIPPTASEIYIDYAGLVECEGNI